MSCYRPFAHSFPKPYSQKLQISLCPQPILPKQQRTPNVIISIGTSTRNSPHLPTPLGSGSPVTPSQASQRALARHRKNRHPSRSSLHELTDRRGRQAVSGGGSAHRDAASPRPGALNLPRAGPLSLSLSTSSSCSLLYSLCTIENRQAAGYTCSSVRAVSITARAHHTSPIRYPRARI